MPDRCDVTQDIDVELKAAFKSYSLGGLERYFEPFCALVDRQVQKGADKYGKALHEHQSSFSEGITEALEELVDFCMYTTRLIRINTDRRWISRLRILQIQSYRMIVDLIDMKIEEGKK